ncbi:uncharacterized protein LOC115414646 [Sphaeramia orbicularis]|uniref:uncharacterized protein LOC115414646 n=1 Tax=Sphaeramia orbicularis TaxID=375764 RepID=UPI001180FFFE|nr:uncharacterized protein LOC115414646 [Sphaeramia orbicularis]
MRTEKLIFDFRRITLFVLLLLQFTRIHGNSSDQIVISGSEVTLPCKHAVNPYHGCAGTTWLFDRSRPITQDSRILKNEDSKSDRVRLLADCSLNIKNVNVQDAGRYTCRHFDKSGQKDKDSFLSVVTLTKHSIADRVTLNCSLWSERCRHTVKWVYKGKDLDRNLTYLKVANAPCSIAARFLDNPPHFPSQYYHLLKCKVRDTNGNKFIFPYGASGDLKVTTKIHPTATTNVNNQTQQQDFPLLLRNIIVSVGLAALVISVVTVNIWTRIKRNKTKAEGNTVNNEGVNDGTINYENIRDPCVRLS